MCLARNEPTKVLIEDTIGVVSEGEETQFLQWLSKPREGRLQGKGSNVYFWVMSVGSAPRIAEPERSTDWTSSWKMALISHANQR